MWRELRYNSGASTDSLSRATSAPMVSAVGVRKSRSFRLSSLVTGSLDSLVKGQDTALLCPSRAASTSSEPDDDDFCIFVFDDDLDLATVEESACTEFCDLFYHEA